MHGRFVSGRWFYATGYLPVAAAGNDDDDDDAGDDAGDICCYVTRRSMTSRHEATGLHLISWG